MTILSGLIGSLANIALLMLAALGLRALAESSRDITSQRSASLVKRAVRKKLNQHLLDFLDEKPKVQETSTIAPPAIEPGIRFEEVHFAYHEERPVLQGISFEVNPDTTVAIVGATGASKSTVIDLLFRFHDPQKDKVLL